MERDPFNPNLAQRAKEYFYKHPGTWEKAAGMVGNEIEPNDPIYISLPYGLGEAAYDTLFEVDPELPQRPGLEIIAKVNELAQEAARLIPDREEIEKARTELAHQQNEELRQLTHRGKPGILTTL